MFLENHGRTDRLHLWHSAVSEATRMADEDLCRAIGEDLVAHYPGHPWNVGCDLEVGNIVIELCYPHPEIPNATFGYRLHPQTMMDAGGQKRVIMAGGELLERFKLARGAVTADSADAAVENGLTYDDTRDGAWIAKKLRDRA